MLGPKSNERAQEGPEFTPQQVVAHIKKSGKFDKLRAQITDSLRNNGTNQKLKNELKEWMQKMLKENAQKKFSQIFSSFSSSTKHIRTEASLASLFRENLLKEKVLEKLKKELSEVMMEEKIQQTLEENIQTSLLALTSFTTTTTTTTSATTTTTLVVTTTTTNVPPKSSTKTGTWSPLDSKQLKADQEHQNKSKLQFGSKNENMTPLKNLSSTAGTRAAPVPIIKIRATKAQEEKKDKEVGEPKKRKKELGGDEKDSQEKHEKDGGKNAEDLEGSKAPLTARKKKKAGDDVE
eukprot:TRINITY_DN13266_c0_g1_i1.p1 TRINITY_DN13266_c0_g1~~TRINITY_DN13266_c0_g1_i1.p1  ORF type:complete len:293 (-),score=119.56 TRINITY_DN13266_c0_g1_i1:33-911(-)